MKPLLIVSAVIEGAAGVGLLLAPSVVIWLLFGAALDVPPALLVGRLAGAALLSLSVACWLARGDEQSAAAAGLIAAMWLYNAAAAVLLAYAGLGLGLLGGGLWPVVLLHVGMLVWCSVGVRSRPA
jgi:hypothetical protein